MTVLIFIAMLLCIQVRANYSTYRPHLPRPPPRTRTRPRPLRRIRVRVKKRPKSKAPRTGAMNTVVFRHGALSLLDHLIWSHRRKRQRLKNALPGFKVKWWMQKVTFREGGGLSIRPRWHIKHKHAIYRVAIGLLLMVITWQLFGTPIGVVGAVIDSTQTGNWSVGATWVGGVAPGTGDDARVMATHIVDVDQATETTGSCEIQATGTLDLLGNTLECDGANGAGFGFDNDGILIHSNGIIHFINTAAGVKVDFSGTGNPYHIHVTVNDQTVTQDTACAAEGHMDIFSGGWETSGTNYQLDVTGYMNVSGTITMNSSTVSTGSLAFTGTINATDGILTINSEDVAGYAFNNDGTYNALGGTLTFTYAGTTLCDFAGTGNPYNIICNHASLVLTLDSNTTFANNLTITAGEMTTSGTNYALTVTAITTVRGTLRCNASAISLGSGHTANYGLDCAASGSFLGGSGNHIIGSINIRNTSSMTATSGTTTVDSRKASTNFSFLNEANDFNHSNGTMVFTYTAATVRVNAGTDSFYNVTINAAANTVATYTNNLTVDNALTITAGELTTTDGTDRDLTVTGDCDITGTITGNASAISLGSLTINSGGTYDATSGTTTITSETAGGNCFFWAAGGTFTHNNGTVTITTATDTQFITGGHQPYNFIVNTTATVDIATSNFTVANDLTVTQGILDTTTLNLTVTADVDITGQITGNASTISYGSLTINSGGTYDATSGTTALTSETAGGRTIDNQIGGTFTHNNGTVDFQNSSACFIIMAGTGNLYNATITGTGNTHSFTAVATVTIENNFTVDTNGKLNLSGSNLTVTGDLVVTGTLTTHVTNNKDLTVTGDTDITGTITGNASAISMGTLKVNSGGTYDATSGTTTLTNVPDGASIIWTVSGGTFIHNNGIVDVEDGAGGNEAIRMEGTGDFYDLTVSNNAQISTFGSNVTVANDLTVESGSILGLTYPGFAGRTWTVTGDVDISGTIDGTNGNSDANQSFGSLTINASGTYTATSLVTTITSETAGGYSIKHDGTWTHNNGTVTITYAGAALVDLIGTGNLYKLIINDGSAAIKWEGNTTIDNDLTITLGTLQANTATDTLTVAGDVDVTGTLGNNSESATWTFGSLTINSGGTAVLTTGTTELTSETAGGYSLFVVAGGTLTTSPGTIDFQITSGPTNIQTTTEALFNVLVSGTQTVTITDATTVGGALSIEAGAGWDTNASDQDLTITGATSISGTLTCNSSAVVHTGNLTINSAGTLTAPDGSGSLTFAGDFNLTAGGTFTHSSGTVTCNASSTVHINAAAITFNNLTSSAAGGTLAFGEVSATMNITVEDTFTITAGAARMDPRGGNNVTLILGTNATSGTFSCPSSTFDIGISGQSGTAVVQAASSAYPCLVTGVNWDWDNSVDSIPMTLQDLLFNFPVIFGTTDATITITRCNFPQPLTVTTATVTGTMCVIDASTLSVSSGLYIEGWFDPTDNTRGGYDWTLVGGDYTLSTNKTYTSRRNFYKPGGATLTLDTGTTLTATDPTVDGTFITAEADLLDTNNGTFTVKYTMDFKIVDAIGVAIQSVVITLYDQFDVQLWTQTTDSNGDITAQATITAIYGIGARQNHPQNLTMVLTGYQTLNYNFVLNRPMDLTLGLPAAATPATGGDSAYTDTITIYRKTGRDDAAQKTYDAGTSVTCSVQQKRKEIKGDTGKVINSTTAIFVPAATAVDVEDKIVLEDTTTVQILEVQIVNAYDGSIDHKVIRT